MKRARPVMTTRSRLSLPQENGGQGRNRTIDTRIFSREVEQLWLGISMSYRGVRCQVCTTMQDDAGLVHAKVTRRFLCAKRWASDALYLAAISN